MVITSNLMAMNTQRMFGVTSKNLMKRSEKLSSGYKINRAADDAAGLAMSEKMRRQIRGLHQGAENIQDGVGFVKTADGALNEAQEILQRINELAVKAANGTGTQEDRAYIDQEIQALKAELTRIFGTTSYNERFIWEPSRVDSLDFNKELIGWVREQAVNFNSTSEDIDITNDNCGVMALNGYTIHAEQDKGVWMTWTGYDGQDYATEPVSWEKLEADDYTFEMSEYFGDPGSSNLYDKNGNPLFEHKISFSVHEKATIDDIIKCINGRTMSSSSTARMKGRLENQSGGNVSFPNDVFIGGESLSYAAAYASNRNKGRGDNSNSKNVRDFDASDDYFLDPRNAAGGLVQNSGQGSAVSGSNLTSKPSATDVEGARESREGWEFTFYMDGIGKVTAKSSSVSYSCNDRDANDEGYFWKWQRPTYGEPYKSGISIPSNKYGSGTLGDVMDALTGRKGSDGTPGLLTRDKGGDADLGGYIYINFSLTSDKEYEYGRNSTSRSVGSFYIGIRVTPDDSEGTVLEKIKNMFNYDPILDFYADSNGEYDDDHNYFYTPTAATHRINVEPIYGDVPASGPMCNFFVQAGPEAGMHIDIEYEPLSLRSLGLQSTNTLTAEDASRAIDSVKKGLEIVNQQRANFGAYQNRLEHAYYINLNSEENTQNAESAIRDADIAAEIIEYAKDSILQQAGASMLSQANQMPQYALQLLG